MLTPSSIPAYIKEICKDNRLVFAPMSEQDPEWHGYTYRLYGKHKVGYESMLEREAEKLIHWATMHYAESHLVQYKMWYHKYSTARKAYAAHYRNYAILVISDPVALTLERAGLLKPHCSNLA